MQQCVTHVCFPFACTQELRVIAVIGPMMTVHCEQISPPLSMLDIPQITPSCLGIDSDLMGNDMLYTKLFHMAPRPADQGKKPWHLLSISHLGGPELQSAAWTTPREVGDAETMKPANAY